jgi:hypothetical protein
MISRRLALLPCTILFLGVHAYADSITFLDKPAFLAATGATSATGALPNAGLQTAYTVGSVTFNVTGLAATGTTGFHLGTLSVGGFGIADWTTRLAGNDIAINGPENLNADLAGLVYSVGFDFVEPRLDPWVNPSGTTPFIDSTFSVTLKNGATTINSFTFSPPNDAASFFGAWSDTAFNRVEIRETTGGAENEFLGQFYTGGQVLQPAVVPEPASLVLLVSGLAAMAGFRWWRKPLRGANPGK